MKNVKYIELVFENCEEVRIDEKYIGYMAITDFGEEIVRVAINSICKIRAADEVALEIFSEANGPFISYGKDQGITIFDRITEWNDITHINVVYEDGEEEYIAINYDEGLNEGKLGAENILQTSKLSDLGNLYLVISTGGEDIDKLFDAEEINDENTINTRKLMLGTREKDDE